MPETKAIARFIEGPVALSFPESNPGEAGALADFCGIIRADLIGEMRVKAIEYTAYRPLADRLLHALAQEQIQRYNLLSCIIVHSLGSVEAGCCSLFIRCTAAHRKEALEGLSNLVERVKAELPVWGKEHFEGGSYQWKINKPQHERHHS